MAMACDSHSELLFTVEALEKMSLSCSWWVYLCIIHNQNKDILILNEGPT